LIVKDRRLKSCYDGRAWFSKVSELENFQSRQLKIFQQITQVKMMIHANMGPRL